MNRETSTISKVNFVDVQLENLGLREAVFQLESHYGLGNFAAQGPVRVEEKAPRHLHRDGAPTLYARAVAQISPSGAENTNGIKTWMLEETPVFHGKHGVAEHLRDIVNVHGQALLARAIEQTAQKLRFNFGRICGRACIQEANLLDRLAAES